MDTPQPLPVEPAWVLSEADSRQFIDAVLNPPEPNAALKAAAARYKAAKSGLTT